MWSFGVGERANAAGAVAGSVTAGVGMCGCEPLPCLTGGFPDDTPGKPPVKQATQVSVQRWPTCVHGKDTLRISGPILKLRVRLGWLAQAVAYVGTQGAETEASREHSDSKSNGERLKKCF